MRKLALILLSLGVLSSCETYNGELTGVPGRQEWIEPDPYGMVFVPMGSYQMGLIGEDVPFAMTATTQTVSVDPFWMDDTEITNNEFRQFVHWVRDSIAMKKLATNFPEDFILEDNQGNYDPDKGWLSWEAREFDWQDEEYAPLLEDMYLAEDERFFMRKELDTRLWVYHYFWVDIKQAAIYENRYNFNLDTQDDPDYVWNGQRGQVINETGDIEDVNGRDAFIMEDDVQVYPDTLVWVRDFTYSFNEPWTEMYFWHPAYDDYPCVGVNWEQARAFSIWRTQLMNNYLNSKDQTWVQRYRLPTESEWEYASRGGLHLNMYPWGGPYTRNIEGCFIANFKNMRGNYVADGGIKTLKVGTYSPNGYGLYDMAGNVAEWTNNAFDESAYSFTMSLNPDYTYRANFTDPPAMKRKVVRGGSWKDVAFYLQCGARTYEYQDSVKCYIGFRCVRSYMGRDAAIMGTSGGGSY